MARPKKTIHATIKRRLGYDPEMSDKDVLKDWKERTTRVCKPCWELKYCPYGPLVEQLPLLPVPRNEHDRHYDYYRNCLKTGFIGERRRINDKERERLSAVLADEQLLLHESSAAVSNDLWLEVCLKSDKPLETFESRFHGELPPLHEYRIPFDHHLSRIDLSKSDPGLRKLIRRKAKKIASLYRQALKTGVLDRREPLDAIRKGLFERDLKEYDPEIYPDEVPETFLDASCNVFGHVCPVFFAAETMSESSEIRRKGRYIPFKTKIRVVRRDNHTCQHCGAHLKDNELEFDHIIPVSKGGSSEEHNLRLTCFGCNRDKSDKVAV